MTCRRPNAASASDDTSHIFFYPINKRSALKNLLLRSLSGIVYVGVIIGTLLCPSSVWFCALCMVFGVVGIAEFRKLMACGKTPNIAGVSIDIFGILCLTSLPLWKLMPYSNSLLLLLAATVFFITYLLLRMLAALYDTSPHASRDTAVSVLGVTYIATGVLATQAMSIYSCHLVLLIFVFIWLNDTGAFITGSLFGKHKMFPRLSPKKSWEGFVGGLLVVFLTSLALGYTGLTMRLLGTLPYFGIGPYELVYFLPIVVVAFATWGDLFESMLKRSVGAKDSGNIIPGHGGLLDRIDSMLFVMPACALMVLFCILL